jgi:hypothetical protein
MKKQLNPSVNNTQEYLKEKTNKLTEKAIFGELYQVRKVNNLIHKLTFFIQKNKELITDHYSQLA